MTTKRRRVTRSGNRNTIAAGFGNRRWYNLPDWARIWLCDAAGWIALALALILSPTALLAVVLGVHALPLEFFGIPGTANGVGLAAVALIMQFGLLALSVKPLFAKRRVGWGWLLAAAVVHLGQSILLQHAITGTMQLLIAIYIYWQVRPRFK